MPCPYQNATSKSMSLKIPRRQYADLYGPTTGDRVRLADTELFIEIENARTTPGEEGKVGVGYRGGRRSRFGDHECCDRGPWRNLQSRYRNTQRTNRGNRQSGQS